MFITKLLKHIEQQNTLHGCSMKQYLKHYKIKQIKNYSTKFIKKAICGISNLKIATGVQAKIFTYMTYGLPVVSSPKAAKNFEKNILEYKSNKELIKLIIDLSKSKTLSLNYSKKSLKFIKNFFWTDIVKNYVNILKS